MSRGKTPTRRSRQRETVLRVLRGTTSHPTADWIYQQVRRYIPNVSLGTIYRNLKVLKEAGEIMELDFGSTFSRFDGNPLNHYHFSCESCDRVFDVDLPPEAALEEEAERRTGFQVTGHRLEFYGLCSDCKNEAERATGKGRGAGPAEPARRQAPRQER
mgnify:CR=1 FL=1